MMPCVALRVFAVLITLTFSVCALYLTTEPETVSPNDKNISLSCFGAEDSYSQIHRLTRLQINKLSKENNMWVSVGVIQEDGTIKSSNNVSAKGYIGDQLSNSFLKITWKTTHPEMYGNYRCYAVGYTDRGEFAVDESEEINIGGTWSDSLELYEFIQETERRQMKNMESMLLKLVKESFASHDSGIHSTLKEIQSTLLENNLNETIQTTGKLEDKMLWPEGNFSLVMPDTGCPGNPHAWNTGFIKSRIDVPNKYFPVNAPLHLAVPFVKDGFAYQQFCSIRASKERQQPWPAGSYCIHELDYPTPCPGGFDLTGLYIDTKNDKLDDKNEEKNFGYGFLADYTNYEYGYWLHFCCRSDGSPTVPIALPVSKPFYLFRYKGTCQEVKGMTITQDVFMMNTAKDSVFNGDHWDGAYKTDIRPDVSIRPLKEELCYYSKNA